MVDKEARAHMVEVLLEQLFVLEEEAVKMERYLDDLRANYKRLDKQIEGLKMFLEDNS